MIENYLKAARVRAQLTVEQAAAAIGVGGDAIYRFERGANRPKLETLERMAAAYGCLPGDLLPNSGGAFADERYEPIAAALAGLAEEEITHQLRVLALQARLNRDAIMRRAFPSMPAEEGISTEKAYGGRVRAGLESPAPKTPPREERHDDTFGFVGGVAVLDSSPEGRPDDEDNDAAPTRPPHRPRRTR